MKRKSRSGVSLNGCAERPKCSRYMVRLSPRFHFEPRRREPEKQHDSAVHEAHPGLIAIAPGELSGKTHGKVGAQLVVHTRKRIAIRILAKRRVRIRRIGS